MSKLWSKNNHIALVEVTLTELDALRSKCLLTVPTTRHKQCLKELQQISADLKSTKIKIIAQSEEEAANDVLSLECAAQSLSETIECFLALKSDNPDEAWRHLINAQDAVLGALHASQVCESMVQFLRYLETVEKVMFPPQTFMSSGFIVIEEECSICSQDYSDCPHVVGRPYMGAFCSIKVTQADLLEVSVVQNPADKRCRVTSFGSENKKVDTMTKEFITPSKKSPE